MASESRYGFSLPSVIFRSRTYANLRGASQAPLNPHHSNATETALPSFPSYLHAQRVDRVDDTITALPLPPPPSPPPTPPSPPEPKKLKKKQSVLPVDKKKQSPPIPADDKNQNKNKFPPLPVEKKQPVYSIDPKRSAKSPKSPPRPKKPSAWTRITNRIKRGLKCLGRNKSSKASKRRLAVRNVEISGPTNFQHVGGVEVLQRERRPMHYRPQPVREVVAVIQQQEVSPTDSDDEDEWQTEYAGTEYAGTEYAATEYAATEYAGTIYAGTEYGGESEWEDIVDE